jgi:hypothetical protein
MWGFAVGDRQHGRVKIDPDDVMTAPGEFDGDSAGTAAGIKYGCNPERGHKSGFTVHVLPGLLQGGKTRIIGLPTWDVCGV